MINIRTILAALRDDGPEPGQLAQQARQTLDRARRTEVAEAERDRLKAAITALLTAQGRMLDGWAEASPERQRELWRNLHEAADVVRADLDPRGEDPDA